MIHCGNDVACLEKVIVETYVRQDFSDGEVDELLSTPRFFYAVRARLAQTATGDNTSDVGDQRNCLRKS